MPTPIHAASPIPAVILDYLRSQHVLSLATMDAYGPWAASVFYAVDAARGALIFLSATSTRHANGLLLDHRVAGTVSDQQRNTDLLRGVQLTGSAQRVDDERLQAELRHLYEQRIPEAAGRKIPLWQLQLDSLKFTDNTLGFGHKTVWTRA